MKPFPKKVGERSKLFNLNCITTKLPFIGEKLKFDFLFYYLFFVVETTRISMFLKK